MSLNPDIIHSYEQTGYPPPLTNPAGKSLLDTPVNAFPLPAKRDPLPPIAQQLLVAIGARMMLARIKCGFTPSETARRVGITAEYYKRIEAGKCELTARIVDHICDALSVTREDILDPILQEGAWIS